jgi:adenylate cyclase class IV
MSEPTREVELKARVDDVDAARHNIESAGAVIVFEGSLRDRIYDTSTHTLGGQGLVLRVRIYRSHLGAVHAHLDWKGPTKKENGFKIRDELTTGVTDPDALMSMLSRIGFEVVGEIDREIAQYEMAGTDATGQPAVVIRFERYPRMDTLVEVEGTESQIELAIEGLKIPRARFSADRLADFVQSFEKRTGQRAAICDSAL